MPRQPHRVLCSAALLLVIVCCALSGPAPRATAQEAVLKDTVYSSPSFGYFIRWHDNEWIVDLDLSFEGRDILGLRDSLENYLIFSGEEGFSGDAEACLDQMMAETQGASGTDFAIAEDSAGEPYEYRDPEQAYVVYQSRLPDADGVLQDLVVYAECQTLIPGKAVFKRQYSGSPEVFEQWYDDIVDTLESVHLPRASAWLPEDEEDERFVWSGEAPLLGTERGGPNLFPFPEEGAAVSLLIDLVDQAGSTRVITFENVSDDPVTVEPANLTLTLISAFDEAEPIIEGVSSITWEDGFNANADGSRTLDPGERATVHVVITPIDASVMGCDVLPLLSFAYTDSAGQYTDFAYGDVSHCFEGILDPRPVLQAPLPTGITRESLMASAAGQLDALGRIPLARVTVAPGAATPDDFLSGPLAAVVESGIVDVLLGSTVLTAPTGEFLTAVEGTALTVRNSTDTPGSLLVLPRTPRDDWGLPLEESPPPGLTFQLLFPDQDLLNRLSLQQFALDRVMLPPGATLDPSETDGPRPLVTALLVEHGAVVMTVPGAAMTDAELVAAGSAVRVPAGIIIQSTSDQPAELLIVQVT